MTDTNAHFLKPSKWHVSQESGFDGDTSVMHITKGAGGNGATGTAMYVSATPRIAANELAALVKDELEHAMMDGKATAKSHEVKGPFTIDSVRVDFREDDAKWTKQVLVIVNNRTRTLYSLSFESSATGWAEAWKLGEPMMRLYSLDAALSDGRVDEEIAFLYRRRARLASYCRSSKSRYQTICSGPPGKL